MNRRTFFIGLIVFGMPTASAQPVTKRVRIAYLSGYSAEVDKPLIAGLRRGLSEHGYVEGRNLVIDARYAAGDGDKFSVLAQELVALKPDLFVVLGPQAAVAAKNAAPTLPIVFANVQDPVATGLVTSLARPGGNMTGMSDFHAASVTKRLELIKEAIPGVARVGVMWNPTNASNVEQLKDLEAAAPRLGMSIIGLPVQRREELEPALQRIKGQPAVALLLLGDIVLTTNMRLIAQSALEGRLPAVYTTNAWTDVGGFMAYGANFPDLYRRSAAFVDKIIKGAKPGDLPIEQPTKFDLVINLRTANAIGVAVPRSLLLRADQVIQ
jgi:putative tryptophan/tyrosine transport system substrate-binding protein